MNKDLLTGVKAQEGATLQAEEMVQVEEKIAIQQAETQIEVIEIKLVPQGKMQAENRAEIIPLLLENPAEIIEIKQGLLVEKAHLEMQINPQEKAHKNKIKEVLSQDQIKEENNLEAIRKRVLQEEAQKIKQRKLRKRQIECLKKIK